MLLIWIVGIIVIPQRPALASTSIRKSPQVADVVEVSPPEAIQQLRGKIDHYQPQVKILSPAADQLLKDDTVSVRLEVKDLPIFKDATLGLGPHVHVLLDNQPYREVYDLNQPLIFKELSPGTHTIRAVASRPWFESFKNPGAYAQVTFHVFTKTEENNPTSKLPLLTYSQPQGQFGAETVLIDFYLSNLEFFSGNASSNTPANWQTLVSINGSSFYIDEWAPLYVKGLKPGKNWVRMELTDQRGRKIENAFNDTIRIIELQENNNDTFSRLIRGDLSAIDAGGIVDPNYKRPPSPVVKPPVPQPSATPDTPVTSPKTETPKPAIIVPAPILKQPDTVLAPAAPVSPTPSTPKSPASKTKLPPTEPNNVQPNSEDRSPRKSVEAPAKSKADQKPVPKAEKDKSRTPVQQPKPSQVKPTETQTATPTDTKLSPVKPPTAAKPVEKERKSSSPTSIPREQKPTQPSSLEDKRPKKTDKTATQTPVKKLAPATKAIPQPSLDPVKPKLDKKESAPAVITKESTNKNSSQKETVITAPPLPKQDKSVGKDVDSSLKTTMTSFWNKIRPAQEATTPSTSTPMPVDKKETQAEAKPKTSQGASASSVPSKISSPKSTTNPSTTKSSKPQSIRPKAPSTPKSKTPSKSTSTNRPPSSASSPMTDKAQSDKGPDTLTKESLEKTKIQATPPAAKSTQPEPSIFSSLRNRWQQPKQKLSTPAPKESTAIKTPAKPKTTDQTSAAPSSNLRNKTSPAKTSTPKVTDKTSTTVKKTPNANKKEVTKPATPSVPAVQPKQTESAFSSFRNRWQQQKQIVTPPAKQETTSTKPIAPKAAAKPSAVKPAPNSSVKKEISPIKTSTPKAMGTSPTVQKTPSADKQETTKPSTPSVPTVQPKQTKSAFSSLRDRWKQQKQLVTPPAKQETTSTKPIAPKAAAKPSTVKPAPNSSVKKEITPTRTPASKIKGNTSTAVKKTSRQDADKNEATQPSSSSTAGKPKQTESAFSSLRNRWQQQKQIVAPPAKQQTTPKTSATPKTPNQTSVVKPAPNSGIKKATTLTPKALDKPVVKASPSKAVGAPEDTSKESTSSILKVKSAQPQPSVFSSLRDRWQQQKQIVAPPAKQQTTPSKASLSKTIERPTTTQQQPAKAPVKTGSPKSTVQTTRPQSTSKPSQAKPSTSANSGFSSIRDRWQQQQKQLSPSTQQKTAPARPKSSIDKTPAIKSAPNQAIKASPGKANINPEKKATSSPTDRQQSEPRTFDPGVFYRRLLSKDEASPKIQTQPKIVSPTPSS